MPGSCRLLLASGDSCGTRFLAGVAFGDSCGDGGGARPAIALAFGDGCGARSRPGVAFGDGCGDGCGVMSPASSMHATAASPFAASRVSCKCHRLVTKQT